MIWFKLISLSSLFWSTIISNNNSRLIMCGNILVFRGSKRGGKKGLSQYPPPFLLSWSRDPEKFATRNQYLPGGGISKPYGLDFPKISQKSKPITVPSRNARQKIRSKVKWTAGGGEYSNSWFLHFQLGKREQNIILSVGTSLSSISYTTRT